MLPPPPDAIAWPPSQHGSPASSWSVSMSVSWALRGVRVDGRLGARFVAIVFAVVKTSPSAVREIFVCAGW